MSTLPLTVLFHEGPIGRAYLAMMKKRGLKARSIMQLLPKPGGFTGLLPSSLRNSLHAAGTHQKAHYWPNKLAKDYPLHYQAFVDGVSAQYGLDAGFLEEIRTRHPLADYADHVAVFEGDGLRASSLSHRLIAQQDPIILFTGGGFVPPSLLDLPQFKILHIHPGHLPDIRGADGVLWSTLVRGRPGASGFFMKPGIDEGDLIHREELSALSIKPGGIERPDDHARYRMVFSYYDPVIRALLLDRLLAQLASPRNIVSSPQDLSLGRTFHFMEKRVRHLALNRIFPGARA